MTDSTEPGTDAGSSGVVPAWSTTIATRIQKAYQAYLEHGKGCRDCPAPGARCQTAERLWQDYREARISR